MMGTWAARVLAICAIGISAELSATPGPVKPLFANSGLINLTISGPLSNLARSSTSRKPVEGSLTVGGAAPETLAIILSTRGITRGSREICPFPPLRITFAQKPSEASLFFGQKSLKLVTHCRPAASFQQYQLLEYDAYRLFNIISPDSFEARLASINYVDKNGRPLTSRLGFFIEDASDVAKRNGIHQFKTMARLPISQLAPRDAARFAVFEYMIGNLDWAMTAGPQGTNCCHNSRLISSGDAGAAVIPVPYDFDFSGLVDAPYATPPEGVPVDNVRQRRYRGYCVHNAAAYTAAADILAKRGILLGTLDDIPQLDQSVRNKATAYLNEFFDQIATDRDVTANLLRTCLN